MRSKLFYLLVVFCLLGLLVHPGCKTAEDTAQYVLTVTMGEGITGTPPTGSYSYTDADLVNYSYSLQTGYENLVVQLDGVTVGSSGVIAMSMSHTLTVTADEVFDVRGDWSGIMYYSHTMTFDLSFSGGLYSGNISGFLDGSPAANGDYTITNGSIEFNLEQSGSRYYFTGTIDNDNRMSGAWDANYGLAGHWELDRI